MTESLVDNAVRRLTDLILSGEIEPETHLQESRVAELLGMSRTPVRDALTVLTNRGLLVPGPWRGAKVRAFTPREVADAYAARATLEGMVCRLLAENGLARDRLDALRRILDDGDLILKPRSFDMERIRGWMRVNFQFHSALVSMCQNAMLARMIELSQSIPLAHPGFVGRYQYNEEFYEHSLSAQAEHHRLVRAIELRQSSRAEAIMREHVQQAAEIWHQQLVLFAAANSAGSTNQEKSLDEGPIDLRHFDGDLTT